MIPRLPPDRALESQYRAFIDALGATGFEGDICADLATRLCTATDNSVYQLLPQAVVYPRSTADVARIMTLGQDPAYSAVTFTPRGGGTGTNGQSLSDGVIIDVSRHMAEILDVDLEQGCVRVQPGVVLDQLNRHLAPYGVFFAPNLSPSSRATLGGMIATDACGKGSRIYGRTSEHVLALETVLIDGTTMTVKPTDSAGLEAACERQDVVGHVHRAVDAILTQHADNIATKLPKLKRFMTGYNLGRIRQEPVGSGKPDFDLTALICGSEGTLATVCEATLRLTPIPTHTELVVLKYRSFEDALGSAELVVASDPGAIETIDQTVMNLARNNIIWHAVGPLLDDPNGPPLAAINLVEYSGTDAQSVRSKVDSLVASVAQGDADDPGRPFGYHVAQSAAESAALWSLRKQGVGLLGSAPGPRKPVAFVEDTVVPPENLRDYVREFRALLDSHGLFYGMFGHIDVGCLHVRPALDMTDPADVELLKTISDGVVELVRKYGGQVWGEHGKGMRSEYNPVFFGPELYGALCQIKGAFDPNGRLNPGKLAIAPGTDIALATVESPTRGALDRTIPAPVRAHFDLAMSCNGNGACFNVDPDNVMCPSSKVTRDRRHSPKGRAGLLREWLRKVSADGFEPTAALAAPTGRFFGESRSGDDFSHEVYAAMDGCLACKACATQCPIKVDVPSLRTDFLALYHTRYRRPLRDYLVASLESMAGVMAMTPRLANALTQNPIARWSLKKLGLVDTPSMSVPSAKDRLKRRGLTGFSSTPPPANGVVLVTDVFTTFYEAEVLDAVVAVVQALDRPVSVLPCRPSGKGHHIKGFTKKFRKIAAQRTHELNAAGSSGAALVGLDPAVTLIYDDEVPHALGKDAVPEVQLMQHWLAKQSMRPAIVPSDVPYYLVGHCTERTADPGANAAWTKVFATLGLRLDIIEVGCCGMCGAFGHEAHHEQESRDIFAMSWQRALQGLPRDRVLATGFSCRHQVKRCMAYRPRHPIEVLADRLTAPQR